MEQVINAKERNYAFVKFIIFFSITVAIIIGAVYFDTLLPKNDNVILRKKIGDIEEQSHRQQQFIAAMEEVKTLNDSINKLGRIHPLVEREITEQLSVMNQAQHQENSLYGTLNKDVFNFVYDYTEINKALLTLRTELQEVEQLKNELNRTKIQLEEANRSLDVYRNGANLGL